MTVHMLSRVPIALTLGLLLAACGGGSDDPVPTPLPATLTVTNATSATLNGIFTTQAISLAAVEKVNPIGGEPEVCSFKFSGLSRADGANITGDIRYLPGTTTLRVMFLAINGIEFASRDSTNFTVDRGADKVVLNGKVLTASTGVASTITVTGDVPMRGGRPEGC